MISDNLSKSKQHFARTGLLIAVEGLDGSGKSTLVFKLMERLGASGIQSIVTNWNDTVDMYNLMIHLNSAGYSDDDSVGRVYSAFELAARQYHVIKPALACRKVVFAVKYTVSAFSHSLARGESLSFLRSLFAFAEKPDLTLYVDISPSVAFDRRRGTGKPLGFWESGLDLYLNQPVKSAMDLYRRSKIELAEIEHAFLKFQTNLQSIHKSLLSEENVLWLNGDIDASNLVDEAEAAIKRLLK